MSDQQIQQEASSHAVVVVGAGPAGIFLSERLAKNKVDVLLINRDIRPGGLVEYGIYPNKYKLKGGIRRGLKRALALPNIRFLGNIAVGTDEIITLEQVMSLGASAVAITVGAQGTKSLAIPGQDRAGVYHAKDLVYHYTGLPPYGQRVVPIGARVLIVGMGNVSVDIAHWLIRTKKVEEVTIIARRGPAERKYAGKEIKVISAHLDRDDFDDEVERIRKRLEAVGQDVDAIKAELIKEFDKKPVARESETRLKLRYLTSPTEFKGGGREAALTKVALSHNELYKRDDSSIGCRSAGAVAEWDMDTAVFAVGDRVDSEIGLPYGNGRYLTGQGDGIEAYKILPGNSKEPMAGVFVAGWARNASEGLVGIAKLDGQTCADHILSSLKGREGRANALKGLEGQLKALFAGSGHRLSDLEDVAALERAEAKIGAEKKLLEYKFSSNKDMFEAIDREQN
jgi:ferredoxin/flavodoxin---NADP+ reductase